MSSILIYYLLQVPCLGTNVGSPINITWFITWHTGPLWGIARHMGSGCSAEQHGKALALGCMMLREKQRRLNAKSVIDLEGKMPGNSEL